MKNDLGILIILAYYNRPKLAWNALRSIEEIKYDNWELVVIDDGSYPEEKTAKKLLQYYCMGVDAFKGRLKEVVYILDTPNQKIAQGGSRHGEYLNKYILQSNKEIVCVLCDDDAILSDYFTKLNSWFQANPTAHYCYSHVIQYNPLTESPFGKEKTPWWTNHEVTLHPVNRIDSSQVAFLSKCFKEDGCRYPSPKTENLDAAIFQQFYDRYGPCPYTGFDGQYKGVSEKNMVARSPEMQFFINPDKE